MRYILALSILMIGLEAKLYARDSLAMDLHLDQQAKNKIAFYQSTIGLLVADTTDSWGFAEVQLKGNQGGFRRAQDAYHTFENGLFTQGISTLGRFKVQGSFSLMRTAEDSLGNNLRGMREDIRPYYYFVQKPGEFERQTYHFTAQFAYELLRHKLYLGSGVDYISHSSYRSVDPRPKISQFHLKVRPELSYHSNGHQLSAGVLWGYGDEDYRLDYKNRNFGLSLSFPDRIHYINQGYGFIVMRDTANLRRYAAYSGWNVSYAKQFKNVSVAAHFAQRNTEEENTHETRFRQNYYVRSAFSLKTYTAGLLLTAEGRRRRQQLLIEGEMEDGSDFNNSFGASNYSASRQAWNLLYLYQRKTSNSWQPEFGVQADFRASTKQDYATEHLLDQAYLEAGPVLALYRMNPNKESYRIHVSPVYRVPLLYDYVVPGSQETVFTREVLYHDYGYFSSNAVGGYAEARIISMRLFRNFAAGLTWNMTYLKPLQSEFLTEDVAAELGGNQLYYSIKLSVFL